MPDELRTLAGAAPAVAPIDEPPVARTPDPIRVRADQLFAEVQAELACHTDRRFALLMIFQWLAGIAAALWISPRTWIGTSSQPQMHLYAAVLFGAVIMVLPVILASFVPGRPITRHVIAVGQMLTGALFIHLTGGRIETHFHIFGSLALLAFYRDPWVLVTGSAVVALDHVVRGVFWPQSVYGVLAASPWRALEHAGWVAFEDIFLIGSIRLSLDATRGMAIGRAQVEASHQLIEREVEERTRELRLSEQRFRRLAESSPVGIFETDAAGHNLYTNKRWQAISGLTEEETRGDGWIPILHPDDRDEAIRQWFETAGKGLEYSGETRINARDGVTRWISSRSVPVMNPDGTVRSHVGTIVDITETKRIEEELIRAREAALEGARLKSEFLANMSHEIRTPMTSIIGMSELMMESELSREQREFLGIVKTSADSLLVLLNDILDFSKIEAGKLELEEIPFSLRDCLGSALKSMAVRAHQRKLELACEVGDDVPDRLIGDPTRLRQLLLNLVGNAIKFTEKGEVVVRAVLVKEQDGDATISVSVQDTGIGIPDDKLGLIFEAFTQADGSTTRRYGGTGLGLAICTQLSEAMGGGLTVTSKPGQGSTFTFTIRLGVESCEVTTPHVQNVKLRDKLVLIIDDSGTNRTIFSHVLDRWQMKAIGVDSGAAGLEALRRARESGVPVDLVLLDLQMPDMDGLMVAEAIKADPALDCPIILLTSAGRHGDAARCRALGVSGYLTKPVMSEELIGAIRTVFGGHAAGKDDTFVTRHSLQENRSRLRLLLAEDNPVNRGMIAHMLEKRGHFVQGVEDGHDVLQALEAHTFDLILMDVQMPSLDGFKTTAIIREKEQATGRHIPIIALTAHAMRGDRERCLAQGMDGYVTKPIQMGALLSAVEELVPRPEPEAKGRLPIVLNGEPEMGEEPIDRRLAMQLMEGDEVLFAEALRVCVMDFERQLARIAGAREKNDLLEVSRAAHRLKGGLSMIAALPASRAAARLELLAQNGEADGCAVAVKCLQAEYVRLTGLAGAMQAAA